MEEEGESERGEWREMEKRTSKGEKEKGERGKEKRRGERERGGNIRLTNGMPVFILSFVVYGVFTNDIGSNGRLLEICNNNH